MRNSVYGYPKKKVEPTVVNYISVYIEIKCRTETFST